MKQVVLGISGASGAALALIVLKGLLEVGCKVHLVFTKPALVSAGYELSKKMTRPKAWLEALPQEHAEQVEVYHHEDFGAKIASGSYKVDATMIVPCSSASLGAIAAGIGDNLLRRVADVAIKEQRKLLLAVREMPFSPLHLENMLRLARAGVIIAPPQPAWYTDHQSLKEVEEVIAARYIELCGLPRPSFFRVWDGEAKERRDLLEEGSFTFAKNAQEP